MKDIRLDEIVEETVEDLELQSGLVLSDWEVSDLKEKRYIILNAEYLSPYIANITDYLINTPIEDRVWACFKNLTGRSYVILIRPLI